MKDPDMFSNAKCSVCGKEIKDDQSKCERCGCTVKKSKTGSADGRLDTCFFCGKEISDAAICPYCGANNQQIDVSPTGNPYTKKYITSDGDMFESNIWMNIGLMLIVVSVLFALYFLFSMPSEVVGVFPFLCIGIVLYVIGYARMKKGQ